MKRSQKDQITADSLKTYMEIAASARNRSLTHVQSGRAFFSEINQASAKFSKERGEFVQDFINKTVIRNQREIKSERPFEIRSNESNAVSLARGLVVEKVFNLKTGQLRREVRTYSGGLSSKKNSCDQLLKAPRLRAVGQ